MPPVKVTETTAGMDASKFLLLYEITLIASALPMSSVVLLLDSLPCYCACIGEEVSRRTVFPLTRHSIRPTPPAISTICTLRMNESRAALLTGDVIPCWTSGGGPLSNSLLKLKTRSAAATSPFLLTRQVLLN